MKSSGPLVTCRFPTAWTTIKKIRKTALRVSPVLSFEILNSSQRKSWHRSHGLGHGCFNGCHLEQSVHACRAHQCFRRTQQHKSLDDVRLESKACTIQTNIEITRPVEDVRLTSELESSSISRRCAATQQPIFLDDVCMETKACTLQTNIEITVPVEDVRLTSELESSSNPRRCLVLRRKSIVQHRALHVTLKIVLDILACTSWRTEGKHLRNCSA